MARKGLIVSIGAVLAVLCFTQAQAASNGSSIVTPPGNFQMDVTHNGNCFTLMWTACDPPASCTINLKWKKSNTRGSIEGNEYNLPQVVTPNNATYTYCGYNTNATNSSCCKYQGGKSLGVSFVEYDTVSFELKHCVPGSPENCVSDAKWHQYVVPTKDECFTGNPCKNGGSCVTAGANAYNCTCTSNYMGKNCDDLKPTQSPTSGTNVITASIIAQLIMLLTVLGLM
ncbi:predicted protein [Nematostella vectensis]|uniref:EGF-like domain-containing protein n=1 Tax=Nematostella vectensis TaxID=45351 RepID=A7RNR1_NEMVE|nr:predicted protein [Nematostella vectensis]|eukprot:XP_001639036.1 predicted protein [Nematostella vectensis]